MPVAGTNAFLGIVNQSCEMNAFCPCSTVVFFIYTSWLIALSYSEVSVNVLTVNSIVYNIQF